MVTTRSVVVVAVVGAAALVAAASATSNSRHHTDGRDADGSAVPSSSARPALPPPTTAPSTALAPTTASHPAASGPFSLVVTMRTARISTRVGSISVASNEPVDPPHDTAEQWNTAVWVKQSTYPSTPDKGTTYVYGHACHYHVCSFTNLAEAQVGDRVRVTTASGTVTYTIQKMGLSARSANSLPSWASDSRVPDRLVLVTCAYEQGDTSTNNIVVVARLTSA